MSLFASNPQLIGGILGLGNRVSRARMILSGSPLVVGSTLLALGGCSALSLRGSRAAAWLLVPLSFGWLAVNGSMEGRTLVVLSYNHGITEADLLAVLTLAVAAARLLPIRGRRRLPVD